MSLASKKRQAREMVKKITKKRQNVDSLDKVVVETATDSESERSDICYDDTIFGSPQRDSPVKSIFEETKNPGGNVNVSNTDTTTNLSDPLFVSIHEKATVIPLEVLLAESTMEEVRTSGILVSVSDTNTNVTMGERMMNNEALGTSSIDTSTIPITPILSSTIKTT